MAVTLGNSWLVLLVNNDFFFTLTETHPKSLGDLLEGELALQRRTTSSKLYLVILHCTRGNTIELV